MRLEERLYGDKVEVKADDGFCRILFVENESGEGIMSCYHVEDGIDLIYNDFHMESWEENKQGLSKIVEINHCREGRFECEFRDNTCAYLEEDSLAINMLTNIPRKSCFPLRHYHGISILIDFDRAQKILCSAILDAPDIRIVMEKLCGSNKCRVIRESESIKHIFAELYTVPAEIRRGYMKIKMMELLLFLSTIKPEEIQEKKYYSGDSVRKVKEIKKLITENPQNHYTLEQLAQSFHLSVSTLKNSFKGVYNQSVYAFLKEYRMNMAAQLLRTTGEDITEIALKVGYSNPSKFSASFQRVYGLSPSEFRKNNRMD